LLTSNAVLALLTNEIIASNKPTGTATVKLTNTVNKNVVIKTSESPDRSFTIWAKDLISLILSATTIKIGAILASGMCEAYGANKSNVNKTNTLLKTPEQRLTAPLLIFVAVRAIAPAAGIPPNKGVMILAKPCPNNALFDRCCFPVIPSATTADSKDSIPPSMAITKAGCQR